MFLKLPASYVEPRTLAPMPDAIMVITDTEFRLRAGDTRITAAIYANPSVVGVAQPILEFPIALGPEERNTQLPALLTALYTVILARPEYTDATLVP